MSNRLPTAIAVLGIVGAALASSGCSAQRVGGPTPSASTAPEQQNADYEAALAKCMKTAGFDLDDPEIQSPTRPQAATDAYDACVEDLGERPSAQNADDPLNQAAGRAFAEKWTECLEDLGYEVPRYEGEPSASVPEGVKDADYEKCDAVGTRAQDEVLKEGGKERDR